MQHEPSEERSVVVELQRRGLSAAEAEAWRTVVTRGPCAASTLEEQVESVMHWRSFFCLEYVQAWFDSRLDAEDAFDWACVGYSPSQALAVQWLVLQAAATSKDTYAVLGWEAEWRRSWLRPEQVIRALRAGMTSPAEAERASAEEEHRRSA